MEQNNFEKSVQHKMDELEIHPSDLVWNNIEKKIGKRKKSKRGTILFLFFFLLLLWGGYWFMNPGKKDSNSHRSLQNVFKKESKTTNITDSSSDQLVATGLSKTGSISKQISKSNSTSLSQKTFPKKNSLYSKPTNIINSSSQQDHMFHSIQKGPKRNKNTKTKMVKPQQEIVSGIKVKADLQTSNPPIEVASNPPNNPENTTEEEFKEPRKEITPIIAQNHIASDSPIIKEPPQKKITTLAIKDSSSVKKSLPAIKKHPWIFGITFSGGTSIAGKTPVGTNYLNLNSPGNSSNGGIPYYYSPSAIKNSTGFIAGVIIEKNISPKTKISIGISYKYYSLMNKVGNKIDSTLSYSLYFFSSNNSYSSTNTVNSYRNNFHYLDLPVSIKFQLNKNKRLPLFWNAGINISQLITSNALQFQSNPGIYYHDNSLFNKTQFGLHTGFSVVLFSQQKTPFAIGPNFYYSASKLADKGLYDKTHFGFIGIRAEILFRKK
jgi:hypothetical protein